MGNAIRAVGRISMLQKSRSGSESSVQSDSDVSSQTDCSNVSSSRPSSIGSEGKSDLTQTKPSSNHSNSVLQMPNQQTNPSHKIAPLPQNQTGGTPTVNNHSQLTFLKEMVDCEAFVGDNARFDVQIEGSRTVPPSVQWYHEGEIIQGGGQYSVIDSLSDKGDYSLIIKNVDGNREGEYTCKVTSGDQVIACCADLILNDTGAV